MQGEKERGNEKRGGAAIAEALLGIYQDQNWNWTPSSKFLPGAEYQFPYGS